MNIAQAPDAEADEALVARIRDARKRLLRMHYESKVGHIGGNLSALDALMVLYHRVLRPDDTFVLSKGHSAGALYTALWSRGLLSDEDLTTFHADGTRLAGHPVPNWTDHIPLATGSLGHGFPVSVGIALGRAFRGAPGHVYCLTSDGEWQEGAMWEALIFLAHRKLANITVLVDVNGLQGFGSTHEVASMSDLADKIAAFGLPTLELDGHDPIAIRRALDGRLASVLLLNTRKGAGVSFMEGKFEWHYLPMNAEQYARALADVENAP